MAVGEAAALNIGIKKRKLYSVPSAYIRGQGAEYACILFKFAFILRDRKRELAMGKFPEYSVNGKPAFALSDEVMAKQFPFCLRTYRKFKRMLVRDGLIYEHANPRGKHGYSLGLNKWLRNPTMYTMPDDVMADVLDSRKLLNFDFDDAKEQGINDALLWNHVCSLFEEQARTQPDVKTLALVPKKLSAVIKTKAPTIRDGLARFVASGKLKKTAGLKRFAPAGYEMLVENPLRDKIMRRGKLAPVRKFEAPAGLTPDEVEAGIQEMLQDVLYWYVDATKQQPLAQDNLHFRKAAEICFYEHYEPSRFVRLNLGPKLEKQPMPCLLHGINAGGKYLQRCAFDMASVEHTLDNMQKELARREKLIDLFVSKGLYDSREACLLDEKSNIAAWYRVVTCPSDSPIFFETMERFKERARRELQAMDHGIEALFLLQGIDAKRLFPYYRQYFDYTPAKPESVLPRAVLPETVKVEPVLLEPVLPKAVLPELAELEHLLPETARPSRVQVKLPQWRAGLGYRYLDGDGHEKYTRDEEVALRA